MRGADEWLSQKRSARHSTGRRRRRGGRRSPSARIFCRGWRWHARRPLSSAPRRGHCASPCRRRTFCDRLGDPVRCRCRSLLRQHASQLNNGLKTLRGSPDSLFHVGLYPNSMRSDHPCSVSSALSASLTPEYTEKRGGIARSILLSTRASSNGVIVGLVGSVSITCRVKDNARHFRINLSVSLGSTSEA